MNLCEPSGLMLLGVALHEALTNAIFHGNLELKSEHARDGREGLLPPGQGAPLPGAVSATAGSGSSPR